MPQVRLHKGDTVDISQPGQAMVLPFLGPVSQRGTRIHLYATLAGGYAPNLSSLGLRVELLTHSGAVLDGQQVTVPAWTNHLLVPLQLFLVGLDGNVNLIPGLVLGAVRITPMVASHYFFRGSVALEYDQ
jgi:hypothetical protein